MTFTANTPAIKVCVRDSFLFADNTLTTWTEGYLVAVTSLASRPLSFTVHLATGALFSRLPITAIACDRFNGELPEQQYALHIVQPFSCLDGDIQSIELKHLKDYDVIVRLGKEQRFANYLFTVDVAGSGLAEDPEQYKCHHILALTDGQLVAMPNNYVLFQDGYFAKPSDEWPKYKRQKKYHWGCA
jgi:hypothetical protein